VPPAAFRPGVPGNAPPTAETSHRRLRYLGAALAAASLIACAKESAPDGPDDGGPTDVAADTDVPDVPGETGDAPDGDPPGDAPDVSPDAPGDVADIPPDVPADGACAPVPPPDPVPDLSIPGESPAGRHETTTVNGFEDHYLYDATEYLKIGIRREWGATIVFFGMARGYGPGTNGTNTIDANDTGREVQVAFYDPDRIMQNCAWNASCRTTPTTCPGSITFLGWNPVQGGNRCNRGSGVESIEYRDGALVATLVPLHWNPNWDRPDCDSSGCTDPALRERRSDVRVRQTLRFVATHVVQVEYEVINLSDLDHAATDQEMPTVYTANGRGGPDLWRVFDSEGRHVIVDTPAGGDGFMYENFDSPGGWVSLQNDDSTYGVGIYYENRLTTFQAWQLRSLPFNNVRARFPFGIPARGSVRARAYLVLGAHATVGGQVAWLDATLAPFGSLDAPADDAEISGTTPVWGWALDNRGVAAVDLRIDGAPAGSLSYGASRPDVCLAWPGYAGCPAVGFTGSIEASTLSACPHLIEAVARDTDGNERVIGRRRVTVVR
jgi:hypothetical protein